MADRECLWRNPDSDSRFEIPDARFQVPDRDAPLWCGASGIRPIESCILNPGILNSMPTFIPVFQSNSQPGRDARHVLTSRFSRPIRRGHVARILAPGLWRRAAAAAEPRKDATILVVLELTGGNDGLNTVVPHADDVYHKSRPTLRVEPGQGPQAG